MRSRKTATSKWKTRNLTRSGSRAPTPATFDDRYLNTPYYIAPNGKAGLDAFAVIRDAIRDKDMVAIGRVVLTNREHPVMIEPWNKALLATTLHYPYEIRDDKPYFEDIPDLKLPDEMKQLADHIVDTKAAHFRPDKFEDHYEAALISLLRAKQKGKEIKEPEEVSRPAKVINLMDALRQSIGQDKVSKGESAKRKPAKKKHAR
jgi:DNA end-binding protein Ku